MRKQGSGRPRTPGLPIGYKGAHYTIVKSADTMRPDGYVRERYVCMCDCGRLFNASKTYLHKNPQCACRSCGSRRGALARPAPKQSTHPLYKVWRNILQRCHNPKAQAYHNYGARGITVCERWHVFDNFVTDMGPCPPGMSIERVENDKGYSPDNCTWATAKEQNNNTRANRWVEIDGVRKTITQWAAHLGTTRSTVHNRITKYGWTVESACTTPVGHPGRKEGTRLIAGESAAPGKFFN